LYLIIIYCSRTPYRHYLDSVGSKLQMLVSLLGLDLNGAYDHVSHERLIDPTQEKAPKLGHENNLGLSLREDTQR
jgi:hypothetical protein